MSSDIEARIRASAKKLSAARRKEHQLWEAHKELLMEGAMMGLSCSAMGRLTNVTKARIWQILRDYEDQNG